MADTKEQTEAYIAALIRERAGWEQKDDDDPDKETAVSAISAELRRVGYDAQTPSQRAEKRPYHRRTVEERSVEG